jgi:hypothetical protein
MTFLQDTRKDKRDVVSVRYLSNGIKVFIVHAVTTSLELDLSEDFKREERCEKLL